MTKWFEPHCFSPTRMPVKRLNDQHPVNRRIGMNIESGEQVTHRLRRMRDWPQWFKVCERLHAAVVNFYAKDSGDISERTPDERVVHDNVALYEATAIGSLVQSDYLRDQHQVMFDIDVPHVYVPSTQKGHGHLIFRKQLSFSKYLGLMEHMSECGLIESGFVDAARNRGEAWLRTPWTPKGLEGNVPEVFHG